MAAQILIIDDDASLLAIMKTTLLSAGFSEPVLVQDSSMALSVVHKGRFAVALIDLVMPKVGGMELLRQIKETRPEVECIIITALDEVSSAVEAMRYGAYDYLVKPLDETRLILTIQRALDHHALRQELSVLKEQPSFDHIKNPDAFSSMIAADEAMAKVFVLAEAAAVTDYNILITGESGTGKELLARVIHALSNRKTGPFVAVNMASFNRALFEDSFFGHEKGAYTGAHQETIGFLERADKGTIFLDEITEMDVHAQAVFLRVIQEKEFYRLGSVKTRHADVRFLAASNKNVAEEIAQKKFREDLYYRLSTCHIHIPPLRERKKDILPLARHFLAVHAEKNNKPITALSAKLADALLQYSFPGNVRELESIIARAVLRETGQELSLEAAEEITQAVRKTNTTLYQTGIMSLKEAEREHIRRVLEYTGGDKRQAAKILGVSMRTLQRKIK